MALPIRALRLPSACSACLRNPVTVGQAIRGKKTATGIAVRLLEDIPTFGRAGTIIQIPRGRMRNEWYPKSLAEYISAEELKKMPENERQGQRDHNFKGDVEAPEGLVQKEKIEIKLLTHQESHEILEATMPPVFTFSAKAIIKGQTQIHGSIANKEIAGAMRSILAAQEADTRANRVVVNEKDIEVYGSGDDPTKIKDLGDFSFSYHIDESGHYTIRRKIRVIEQEAEPAAMA